MSTRFILFGLFCIVVEGYASSQVSVEVAPGMDKSPMTLNRDARDAYDDEINLNDLTQAENDEEGCYPQVGCFKSEEPWSSDKRPLPAPTSPKKVQTYLHFYSRKNFDVPRIIQVYPDVKMNKSQFDSNKKTVLIIHGYEGLEKDTWKEDLKDVYLRHVDANVIVVDWGNGYSNFNYFQMASNTRLVGRQLNLFVQYLIKNYQADPKNFHLIGHGLGAQICSYLAKEVPGIGRLTALDPAQPYFEGFPKTIRLDKSDAKFVDVIHTDSKPFIPDFGFGMIAPYGHVDFYVNGGFDQPGCVTSKNIKFFLSELKDTSKYTFSTLSQWFHCSHVRAYQYFIQAINHTHDCTFWGKRAAKTKISFPVERANLNKKIVTDFLGNCTNEVCVPMGLNTENTHHRGVYVVKTLRNAPFCKIEEKSSGGFLNEVIDTVMSVPKKIGQFFGVAK